MSWAPWDPGLQNERTGLAWQRTMLSGLAASLLVARLLSDISIILALSIGLSATLCTAGFGWLAVRRFRHHENALRAGEPLSDGRVNAMISAVVMITALGAILYVLLG